MTPGTRDSTPEMLAPERFSTYTAVEDYHAIAAE